MKAQIYLAHGFDLSGSLHGPLPIGVTIWYWRSISKGFWNIEAQMYLAHGFDLSRSRDVMGHLAIRYRHPTSYRWSIGADTLSPMDFEILRLKCILDTVLPFLGHVTS